MRHGKPWLTCAMRPSGGPLWNLASIFATFEGRESDTERIGEIVDAFGGRGATLASVAGKLTAFDGKSLCVLVDQFEELFRFEKETSREEAELFADLIVSSVTGKGDSPADATVHVIVTMRSEFLGECARFDGLAETINTSQYLVPRMDENALIRAVRRPAEMFGGQVSQDLADRLISSVRGREDELPLLQHGLMLMWREAVERGPATGRPIALDGAMVDKAGGLAELLSNHADDVMSAVARDEPVERTVERLFRALTDVNAEGAAIRRPQLFGNLLTVTEADRDALHAVIDAFRADGVSFLTPYEPAALKDDTIIDISHEALIRCWRKISDRPKGWLKREFEDGQAWRSLLIEAREFETNPQSVLSPASTAERERWFGLITSPWAERYGGGWTSVQSLLVASRKAADAASHRNRMLLGGLSLTIVVAFLIGGWGWREERRAENSLDAMVGTTNDVVYDVGPHVLSLPRAVVKRFFEHAISGYDLAIQIDPNRADLYLGRAYARGYDTLSTEAFSDIDKSIALDPSNSRAYVFRGYFLILSQRFEEAIGALTQAIKLDPKNVDAYLNRGAAYRRGPKDYDKAYADYTKAIELDSDNAEAYNRRCWIGVITNTHIDEALADCTTSIKLRPENYTTYDSRGYAYLRRGDAALAIADFKHALSIRPQRAQSLYGLSLAELKVPGEESQASADRASATAIDKNVARDMGDFGFVFPPVPDESSPSEPPAASAPANAPPSAGKAPPANPAPAR